MASISIRKSLLLFDFSWVILFNFVIYLFILHYLHQHIGAIVREPYAPIPQALKTPSPFPFRLNVLVDEPSVNITAWEHLVSNLNSKSPEFTIDLNNRQWTHGDVPDRPHEVDLFLYSKFKKESSPKVFSLFVFCSTTRREEWVAGIYRFAWVFADCSNMERVVRDVEPFVEQLFGPLTTYPVKVTPFYTFAFTLLNASPTKDWLFNWEWGDLYQAYLGGFLRKVEPVIEPMVESQVLHFGHLFEKAAFKKQENGACVEHDDLREFVGYTGKWNIVSTMSVERTVEFLVYIPPERFSPLTICNRSEISFAVPRWGTAIIHNPQTKDGNLSEEDLLATFQELVFHMRALLGLPDYKIRTIHSPDGIASWEVDFLFRINARESIAWIRDVLTRIEELLSINHHVPVTKDIANLLTDTVKYYNLALDSCKVANYKACSLFLKTALKTAMDADRHQGMLPMVFFSLKFTYATYSPFFLPTLMMTTYALLSRCKHTFLDDDDVDARWLDPQWKEDNQAEWEANRRFVREHID